MVGQKSNGIKLGDFEAPSPGWEKEPESDLTAMTDFDHQN